MTSSGVCEVASHGAPHVVAVPPARADHDRGRAAVDRIWHESRFGRDDGEAGRCAFVGDEASVSSKTIVFAAR